MIPLSIRILIVDDMQAIRDLVRNHLKTLGYAHLFEASDGGMALVKLMDHFNQGTPIDFVISDWNMPHMKGLELLKRVRAEEKIKSTPFILLTSEAERSQVTEAVLAGVSQYIVKPFSAKSFGDKMLAAWTKHHK